MRLFCLHAVLWSCSSDNCVWILTTSGKKIRKELKNAERITCACSWWLYNTASGWIIYLFILMRTYLHIRCDIRIKFTVPTWIFILLSIIFSLVNTHLPRGHNLDTVFQDKANNRHALVHFHVTNAASSLECTEWCIPQCLLFSFLPLLQAHQCRQTCRVTMFVLSIDSPAARLHIFISQNTPPFAHLYVWLLPRVFTTVPILGPSFLVCLFVRCVNVLFFPQINVCLSFMQHYAMIQCTLQGRG